MGEKTNKSVHIVDTPRSQNKKKDNKNKTEIFGKFQHPNNNHEYYMVLILL